MKQTAQYLGVDLPKIESLVNQRHLAHAWCKNRSSSTFAQSYWTPLIPLWTLLCALVDLSHIVLVKIFYSSTFFSLSLLFVSSIVITFSYHFQNLTDIIISYVSYGRRFFYLWLCSLGCSSLLMSKPSKTHYLSNFVHLQFYSSLRFNVSSV